MGGRLRKKQKIPRHSKLMAVLSSMRVWYPYLREREMPKNGPEGQSQSGAHGKETYPQAMKTYRNHVGHNGSCGGSGHAHAKTGRKALYKKHGERIHHKKAANTGGEQQQPCQ